MFIYQAEQAVEGLANKVEANCSVAYSIEVRKWTEEDRQKVFASVASLDPSKIVESLRKTSASLLTRASISDSDLYFTKSILVSTNWNHNDDVFGKNPVWAARHTPDHKRTNIGHDETQLVGHITDTWALDNDGLIIPDNCIIDDLPDLYHIANGAVIYTNWQDDDLIARTQELVEQIEANEKCVSMEALFSNFDYAIITPEEQFHVVARQEDTAFLTKHLRAYGGSGKFEGCKLGRLLRNITFCGKGYVDNPANPYSVIFNDDVPFNFSAASTENPFGKHNGVFISCSSTKDSDNKMGNTQMSDTLSVDLLTEQNKELRASVVSLQGEVKELSSASVTEKTSALKAHVSELEGKIEVADKARDDAKAEVVKLTEAKANIETQLTEANDAKTALEGKITEAQEAKTKAERVSYLVEGGYDKEVAEQKVEIFATLSDEQFEAIASELVKAKKKDEKEEKDGESCGSDEGASGSDDSDNDDSSSDSTGEAAADEGALENADAQGELDMSANAGAEDDNTSLRDELRQAIASRSIFGDEGDESSEE